MSPEQAKIIAAWESLHPIFRVSPSKHHKPTPGDPWRFLIQQCDNDLVIGAVSRTKFMATHKFNEALVSQLRDSLMTGRMPKPLATLGIPTPLQSPEGVLTAHPRDAKAPEPEPENKPTRQAPWNITPLQNRILDAWEGVCTTSSGSWRTRATPPRGSHRGSGASNGSRTLPSWAR